MFIRNKKEVIFAYGHENILSTHNTTVEFTKDIKLSKRGNCIVAVSSNKSVNELSVEFKRILRKNDSQLEIIIEVEGIVDRIIARGSKKLSLTNTKDIVIRKSDYICDRTLAIRANKAACDLNKELVNKLKDPKIKAKITLQII